MVIDKDRGGSYRDAATRPAQLAWTTEASPEQASRSVAANIAMATTVDDTGGAASTHQGHSRCRSLHVFGRLVREYEDVRRRFIATVQVQQKLKVAARGESKDRQQAQCEQLRNRLGWLHDPYVAAKLMVNNGLPGHEGFARFECGLGEDSADGGDRLLKTWRDYLASYDGLREQATNVAATDRKLMARADGDVE